MTEVQDFPNTVDVDDTVGEPVRIGKPANLEGTVGPQTEDSPPQQPETEAPAVVQQGLECSVLCAVGNMTFHTAAWLFFIQNMARREIELQAAIAMFKPMRVLGFVTLLSSCFGIGFLAKGKNDKLLHGCECFFKEPCCPFVPWNICWIYSLSFVWVILDFIFFPLEEERGYDV
jgi:hypothetical protein